MKNKTLKIIIITTLLGGLSLWHIVGGLCLVYMVGGPLHNTGDIQIGMSCGEVWERWGHLTDLIDIPIYMKVN